MVWYGMVWYGLVCYGMVWYGMVCMYVCMLYIDIYLYIYLKKKKQLNTYIASIYAQVCGVGKIMSDRYVIGIAGDVCVRMCAYVCVCASVRPLLGVSVCEQKQRISRYFQIKVAV